MRVSLNTIKQFTDLELPPVDELVQRINQQLGGVEEVIDLSDQYKDAVIVRVVEAEQHPNADKLRVCKVDDSGAVSDVPRDENSLVQVVCGAPNAHAGMYAVWLPPGSTVPASYDDAEPFVLGARELRGVLSQGMLAAGDELALNNDHDGIVELTTIDLPLSVQRRSGLDPESSENELNDKAWTPEPSSGQALNQAQGDGAVCLDGLVGRKFAEVFGLDDTIIDIENKMFTHRPDLFGQLGVAREISAILLGVSDKSPKDDDTRFVNPDWYFLGAPEFMSGDGSLELEVFNGAPEAAPRFMAVALDNVTVGPSPMWLQVELLRWGGKPINNIVDLTNYMMLLTAQPTHAYDYDKLRGHRLGVRMARDGEKILLLNGKEYSLTEDDIVIADGEGAVGLAGIMGGGNSEVSAETTRIVLEVANFDMYAVRKSSMRHGVFTDALTRFNKGQSPLQNGIVLKRLMELVQSVVGGQQASPVHDLPMRDGMSQPDSVHGEVLVSIGFINERLGMQLTENQIGSLLRRVNFAVYPSEADPTKLSITAPYWRTDIELPEDIVEEVGRLYGFDKLPRELPRRVMKPVPVNQTRRVMQAVRDSLAKSGANEVLTYSFTHENTITKAGQDAAKAFGLSNALSPDLQYYRLSVLPSLLDKVHMNIKAGHGEFVLYEIGKAHHKDEYDDGLPRELGRVAGVYARKKPAESAPYYQAKRLFEQIVADFGVMQPIRYQKLSEFDYADYDVLRQLAAPFDPERSSMVYLGEQFGGVIGEFKQSVTRGFKLPEYAAGFELFVSLFAKLHEAGRSYTPLSRFPSATQDISLRVAQDVPYEKLYDIVHSAVIEQADGMTIGITPVTIYQPEGETAKTVTLRLKATSYERTLRDDDIKPLLEHAAGKALEVVGATLV